MVIADPATGTSPLVLRSAVSGPSHERSRGSAGVCYSWRRETIGSRRLARQAGHAPEATATASSSRTAEAMETGSPPRRPNNCVSTYRVANHTSGTPSAKPTAARQSVVRRTIQMTSPSPVGEGAGVGVVEGSGGRDQVEGGVGEWQGLGSSREEVGGGSNVRAPLDLVGKGSTAKTRVAVLRSGAVERPAPQPTRAVAARIPIRSTMRVWRGGRAFA